jgi:hypothetical protein
MPYYLNAITGELDLTVIAGNILTDVTADVGTASPVGNNLNVFGDAPQGIQTVAGGDTLTITAFNASDIQKGVSELATDPEAIAGTDSTRTIVPTSLKAKLGSQTDKSIPYGQGDTNALGWTNALTDGQVVIGSTLGTPQAGNILSAGGSVTVTNTANGINLEAGGGVPTTFTAEDGSTCAPVANNLNVVGTATNGISTTAAGNTLTVSMATPFAGDFAFENNAAATPRVLMVENNDADPGSYAAVAISTEPGGGDPYLFFEVDGATRYYALGVDNSVAGDPLKLTNNVNPSSGDTLVNITSTGVVTLFNDLDVTEGGTGVSTLTSHGILMGNGAGDIQALGVGATGTVLIGNTGADPSFSATPSVTSITIANSPSAGTDGANKTYVDLIASGIKFKNTVKAASTAPLTTLYNNGVGGVGATLTNNGALVAFAIDGYTAFLHDRILIKDQAAPEENGIYQVETLGSGAVAWVLMRTTDYDTPTEMLAGSLIPVQFGTANLETFWLQTSTVATVGVDAVTYNQFSATLPFATLAQVKTGTSTSTVVNPSTMTDYMADMVMTGFISWTGAGAYYDDTTLGTFSLLRGGTGYIKGKLISFAGAQSVTGMTAGNLYWIYIDSSGVLQKTSTFATTIFTDNIPLFECLRDSTAPTNNQVTVKENHPYEFQSSISLYNHDVIGCIIQNITNGANITLNGTQKIQINGADVLSDHGLNTTIPDSGGAGVSWYKYFTLAGGKWALYNTTDTFSGHYNNGGVVAALSANRFAVYTLYCSKDNLNTTTPFYFAVLHTAQFNTQNDANTAISNGTIAKASNELANLEISQLGYIIFRQSTNAIVQVTISKATLKQTLSTGGTNTAALVNTNTTNFNGWLDSTDTNVQSSLDELDDSRRITEVTDAAVNLVPNRGILANRATLVTATLPTVCKVGDEFEVVGKGAGKWLVAQNANQSIHWISSTTTVGVGGSLAATNIYDSIKFYCTVANLEFTVVSHDGNITIV